MKNLKKQIVRGIKVCILALVLSAGVSYVFADWTPPQNTPPLCPPGQVGCDAPVHVGTATQEKGGMLKVHGFRSFLLAVFDQQIQIKGGAPALNKILSSDATGLGSWKNVRDIIGDPLDAKAICERIGGVWTVSTQKCAFAGGTGGSGGITSINTSNVINNNPSPNALEISSIVNGAVSINFNTRKVCEVLGGTWSSTNPIPCSLARSSGTTNITNGDNILNITNNNGVTNINFNTQQACIALGGTWDLTLSKCSLGAGGITFVTPSNLSTTVDGVWRTVDVSGLVPNDATVAMLDSRTGGENTGCQVRVRKDSSQGEGYVLNDSNASNENFVVGVQGFAPLTSLKTFQINALNTFSGFEKFCSLQLRLIGYSGGSSSGTGGGTGGGVTQIIAGNNVTISPTGGTGAVTINSTGGSGSFNPVTACPAMGGVWNSTLNKCNFGIGAPDWESGWVFANQPAIGTKTDRTFALPSNLVDKQILVYVESKGTNTGIPGGGELSNNYFDLGGERSPDPVWEKSGSSITVHTRHLTEFRVKVWKIE